MGLLFMNPFLSGRMDAKKAYIRFRVYIFHAGLSMLFKVSFITDSPRAAQAQGRLPGMTAGVIL